MYQDPEREPEKKKEYVRKLVPLHGNINELKIDACGQVIHYEEYD